MPEMVLGGCTAEPLAAYLKALGVLRLIGEQADSAAAGCWRGEVFVLETKLTVAEIEDFFVDRYAPTPVISPWNSGSGFGADDATKSKTAYGAVRALRSSANPRLAAYRRSIDVAITLAERADWSGLSKEDQVALCRSSLPDEALAWLDAAVVLTSDSRTFPPLLGTGGNDGRLDFGSNVMQRVLSVIPTDIGQAPAMSAAYLGAALFADADVPLQEMAIGQFDPMAAGGPGSSPSGSASGLANPWDFVLLFEGAMLFASSVARRFGSSGPSATAVPFTVEQVRAGYGSAAVESSRGELWAPLWRDPTTSSELRRFIGEARLEFKGQQARTGLDAARALASLGVDRGVESFVRYGFLERNGLSTFCVPLGRYHVAERDRGATALLGQLDGWLRRLERVSNLPASISAAIRRVNDEQFRLSVDNSITAVGLQRVLVEIAHLEHLVARSRTARDGVGTRLPALPASEWLPLIEEKDGSAKLDLAIALSSLRGEHDARGWLRTALVDIQGGRAPVDGFRQRRLVDVLADALIADLVNHRPARTDESTGDDGIRRAGCFGRALALPAMADSVKALLFGMIDEGRLEQLVGACLLFDWRGARRSADQRRAELKPDDVLPAAFALLKPCFHHHPIPGLRRELRGEAQWVRLMLARRTERAAESALRALRLAGQRPVVHSAIAAARGVDGARLAAACLVPLSTAEIVTMLNRVVMPKPETENR
ncbi:MAG: type I-U CRISPR-associated protein Csx17 [Ilumatobacteraceae bacterium]